MPYALRVTEPVLVAEGLVKSYGGQRVVDGLSLSCRPGQVLGLLGANGAGKTTTLRMLYGFIEPEAGEIRYDGRLFRDHRRELKRFIGVCSQDDTLDPEFTVEGNLRLFASYFRPRVAGLDDRVEEILRGFDLVEFRNHRPEQLSGGYKRRLMIARSIVHGPRILFLDEPTTGLDPRARVTLWELVHRLRADGLSIILTTHYMDEAERLSDDLLVLSRGKAVAQGAPQRVIGDLIGEHVIVVPGDNPELAAIEAFFADRDKASTSRVLGDLVAAVSNEDLGLFTERFGKLRFAVRNPTLDDLFLKLAGTADSQEVAS